MHKDTWIGLWALALVGCGASHPGDKCSKEGTVACGPGSAVLLCQGGTYQGAGQCPEHLGCSNVVGGDGASVRCGQGLSSMSVAPEGAPCQGSGFAAYACSSTDSRNMIHCIDGKWQVDSHCYGACGLIAPNTVGCVSGPAGSSSSGSTGFTGSSSSSSSGGSSSSGCIGPSGPSGPC